jgi:hypothetical protein
MEIMIIAIIFTLAGLSGAATFFVENRGQE